MNCLTVNDQILFLGTDNGYIHLFNSLSLEQMVSLPNPPFAFSVDLKFSGCTNMIFDPVNRYLTAIYNNTNMCVWEIKDGETIKQRYLAMYHHCGVADLDMLNGLEDEDGTKKTVVSASHDHTIRLWSFNSSKTISFNDLRVLISEPNKLNAENQSLQYTEEDSITAVRICHGNRKSQSYGKVNEIVTGNRSGKICVYNGDTFKHLLTIMAHNKAITVLTFFVDSQHRRFLVSGSRDRLIHIMDANNEYRLLQTLDIHSSSITSIILCETLGHLNLITTAADRGLMLSVATANTFQQTKRAFIVSTPNDVHLVKKRNELVLACQDGYIRILNQDTLQGCRIYRGCLADEAQLSKVIVDKFCALLVSAATDKTINILNFKKGDILVTLHGHSKTVTGLAFTPSGDHILSSAMDGVLFAWKLSERLKATINDLVPTPTPKIAETDQKDTPKFFSEEVQEKPHECVEKTDEEVHIRERNILVHDDIAEGDTTTETSNIENCPNEVIIAN